MSPTLQDATLRLRAARQRLRHAKYNKSHDEKFWRAMEKAFAPIDRSKSQTKKVSK